MQVHVRNGYDLGRLIVEDLVHDYHRSPNPERAEDRLSSIYDLVRYDPNDPFTNESSSLNRADFLARQKGIEIRKQGGSVRFQPSQVQATLSLGLELFLSSTESEKIELAKKVAKRRELDG